MTPDDTTLTDTTREAAADLGARARTRLRHVSDAASDVARDGMDRLRDTGDSLRRSALDARDMTAGYVRDEPMKSLLFAAAAGAALALAAMALNRLRDR